MKLKTKLLFKVKSLSTPCRSMLSIFKFKFKTPIFIRSLRFRKHQSKPKTRPPKKLATRLKTLFKSLRESRETNRLTTLKSFSEAGYQIAPFPSPITPAYVKMKAAYDHKEEILVKEEVEEACRSFEKCLMEMIVEGGKVGDLVDVEELLCSWKNLKSPIFVDLVCRFYGELCKDLFGNRGTPYST